MIIKTNKLPHKMKKKKLACSYMPALWVFLQSIFKNLIATLSLTQGG